MAHKERSGHSICPGTILSALSILLYCAGFIRVELRLNDQDNRLRSLRDAQSTTQHTDSEGSELLERTRRSASKPSPADMKQDIVQRVDALFKMCQQSGSNACVPGPRGPPGEPGQRGSRGKRGQKGRQGTTGRQGIMGPPGKNGKSGKQGIMGNPGPRGEKGATGDAGPQGMPGPRGEPGESISPPHVIVSPSHVTINESLGARLQCYATGNPRPQIEWVREGGSLPSNRTIVSDIGELLIKKVGLEDSGRYKCVARNILGAQEGFGNLTIQARPRITLNAGPTYVAENTDVTLPKCHVTGFPVPKIKWSKAAFVNLPVVDNVQEVGQLRLLNVTKQDSGWYKCEASNLLGSDSSTTNLIVLPLPKITTKPPEVLRVISGKDVSANCLAMGNYRIVITWSRSKGSLPTGRSHVLADGTLKITNVVKEDAGQYVCTASTAISKTQAAMQLNVASCEPVGVQDVNQIPDSSMTTTSSYDSGYLPHYGRLHGTRGAGGWLAATNANRYDYLQIDLGAKQVICGVATQGTSAYNEWTTRYKLAVSLGGISWSFYREKNKDKEFSGNFDRRTVVRHIFENSSIDARYVRFHALAYNNYCVLRVEIFVLK